jgi:hypothetical protein
MFQLGKLATYQTPLLTDLHAAAPGLNKLAKNLPSFNNGTQQSLSSLGGAAHVGKFALANSKEEIAALNQASAKAYPAADQVASFLESVDDPKQAVEEDACARHDLREQPGEADRRVQELDAKLGTNLHGDQTVSCKWANGTPSGSDPNGGNPGFTGMEGLLNYAYIQTNSLNLFDQLGHALGITLVSAPGANEPCAYQTGPEVAAKGGGETTDPRDYAECAGILGDRQPGINYARRSTGLFGNLPRYDGSVCPEGSTDHAICDPTVQAQSAALSARGAAPTQQQQEQQPAQTPEQQDQQKQLEKILKGVDPNKLKDETQKQLEDLLNLPQLPQLPQLPDITQGLNPDGSSSTGSTTSDLLDFLLGQ